jgi:hypothetical protein
MLLLHLPTTTSTFLFSRSLYTWKKCSISLIDVDSYLINHLMNSILDQILVHKLLFIWSFIICHVENTNRFTSITHPGKVGSFTKTNTSDRHLMLMFRNKSIISWIHHWWKQHSETHSFYFEIIFIFISTSSWISISTSKVLILSAVILLFLFYNNRHK